MAYDYDKLYGETPNALGGPNAAIVSFFQREDISPGRVLDIGCGQGRDALFIARLGHKVVGVDLSANGIRDMLQTAQTEGLPVEGSVADLVAYAPDGLFDVVVMDRTLHMLDEAQRLAVFERLIGHVAPKGWVLIVDESPNIAGLKRVLGADGATWTEDLSKKGYLFVQRD